MFNNVNEKIPFKWNSLKGAMGSKFAKVTVVVPVVGWVLVYNDNLLEVLGKALEVDLSGTLSWKLYVFYVGLFLISTSSIIYSIFCPDDIKRHDSHVEYAKSSRQIFTENFERRLSSSNNRDSLQWQSPPDHFRNNETQKFPLNRKHAENEEEIIDALLDDYQIKNACWPLVRLLALALFVLGASLASIPTLYTVRWASCLVIEDASGHFGIVEFQDTCAP